ncbi:OmpA family protein [Falsiroseomonas selenitidurans]|uniref:OmpA family protein n=1 Tax=Falsiroseomonas selenitidurans TaxID=2716335 RepID=A0ABX1E5E8_9PROT|nr:OmpA family protein [Falsiroseomonas selenitidurans]NKC30160.1 OmpA family protein [Falsiroseomonas selenitidurans]
MKHRLMQPMLVALLLAGGPGLAQAQADHPLVGRYQGATLRDRTDEAFTAYPRIIGFAEGAPQTETREGRLTRLAYDNPDGRSTLEILRNHLAALQARPGFRLDWQCAGRAACGSTARTPQGRGWNGVNGMNVGAGNDVRYATGQLATGTAEAFIAIGVTPRRTLVHVLEVARMEERMVAPDAATLAAELARSGRATLPGVFFDTGEDTLRPESDAALAQAAALLRSQPDLRLRVEGHTDAEGDDAFNRTLSQRRADRVRQALVERHGIAPARLTAAGLGEDRPVADNATPEGRARNRRVELVRP